MRYVLFVLFISATFVFCKTKAPVVEIPETPAVAAVDFTRAEKNYKNYCSGCHGEQMQAFVDRQWKHGSEASQIFASIKNGITVDGMPSYDTTFTDEEVNELVAYIQTGIANVDKYKPSGEKLAENPSPTEEYSILVEPVVTDLEVPWSIQVLEDGTMFYTERKGSLTMVKPDQSKVEIKGVPAVRNRGQGGLLEVELHPNFATNKMLFLSYSKMKTIDGRDLSTTVVISAILLGDELTQVKEIFEALPYRPTTHHYGCKLEFDKNGYLFISVGERGFEKENPQFLDNHGGKIHRIKIDGSIPEDNPFVNAHNVVKSIYCFGNRNPQGLALNPMTGDLWENEHGPRGGDEVNLILPGKNYGWPVISYGINYNGTTITNLTEMEGMEQPATYYVPSIAASGMVFVTSDKFAKWKGNLLVGSLRFNYVDRVVLNGKKVEKREIMLKNVGRLRDIHQGKDGYIYIATERPGTISRLKVNG